jgi:hypothetical protein
MIMIAPLLLALASPAQEAGDEAAQIAQAVERGRMIFAYDRAAWAGTDAMLKALPDARDRVGGYVVDGTADAPRVVFFDKAALRLVYVARFERGRLIEGAIPGAEAVLGPDQKRMIAARQSATRAIVAAGDARPCADKPFNTVILPPTDAGSAASVYMLTPQTTTEQLPIGGHYRVDVDAQGRAGTVRRFTRSCVTIGGKVPKDARPAAAVVSHLLDPTPTEIHVFSSMALGKPLYVATMQPTRRLWVVSGGAISPPRAMPAK